VKAAIESILRSCHKTYSQALLTSSRTTIGNYFYYMLAALKVFKYKNYSVNAESNLYFAENIFVDDAPIFQFVSYIRI